MVARQPMLDRRGTLQPGAIDLLGLGKNHGRNTAGGGSRGVEKAANSAGLRYFFSNRFDTQSESRIDTRYQDKEKIDSQDNAAGGDKAIRRSGGQGEDAGALWSSRSVRSSMRTACLSTIPETEARHETGMVFFRHETSTNTP